jgi:multiple PDZ domain protein
MKDDQLLSVNGESVLGISHGAILDKLQNISKSGDPLRLVVGRIVSNVSDDSFSDIDSSSDAEEVEVELTKPAGSKGLGISINALVNDDNGEDKGIYIRSVNPNGPAGMSGRVRRKDRILQVNHHSLKGLSNMEAAEVLRGAGSKVRLVLERKRGLGNDLPEIREDQILSMVDKKSSKNDNPIAQWQTEMTGQLEQKDIVRGDGPVAMETNDGKEEENIIQSWSSIVGNDKEIIVAYINKPADEKGLGFRMESIAVVDDSGQKQIGSIHHMIKHIREGGPMDSCECLNEGDEILEVNGETLMGMSHDRAIEIVRQTSDHVMVVVCRTKIPTDRSTIVKEASDTPDMPFIEVQQPTTSESEDDHCTSSTTMTSSSSPSLQAIYQTVPDFSRRFERLSWRERHMEETRRLKERFESRRVEYNRYFQEQEDELRRAEQETAERRIRLQEEEEKHKQDTDGKRSSLKSGLHYSYYSPVRFPSLHEV